MIGENLADRRGPDIAAAVICCFGSFAACQRMHGSWRS